VISPPKKKQKAAVLQEDEDPPDSAHSTVLNELHAFSMYAAEFNEAGDGLGEDGRCSGGEQRRSKRTSLVGACRGEGEKRASDVGKNIIVVERNNKPPLTLCTPSLSKTINSCSTLNSAI